jgi:hypothetical protein
VKNNEIKLIQEEIKEATEKYLGLTYNQSKAGLHVVTGSLEFAATFNDFKIEDAFSVEITLTNNYPKSLPEIKETGGRIPKSFHLYDDDTFCLGAPLAAKLQFAENKTFVGYIDKLVIPYLYSFAYFEIHGEMPYGELSHSGEGIIEYYKEFFKVSSKIHVLKFLQILYESKLNGHHFCPCNSGQRLRNCHGPQLHEIKDLQNKKSFAHEYVQIIKHLIDSPNKEHMSFLKEKWLRIKRSNLMKSSKKHNKIY